MTFKIIKMFFRFCLFCFVQTDWLFLICLNVFDFQVFQRQKVTVFYLFYINCVKLGTCRTHGLIASCSRFFSGSWHETCQHWTSISSKYSCRKGCKHWKHCKYQKHQAQLATIPDRVLADSCHNIWHSPLWESRRELREKRGCPRRVGNRRGVLSLQSRGWAIGWGVVPLSCLAAMERGPAGHITRQRRSVADSWRDWRTSTTTETCRAICEF